MRGTGSTRYRFDDIFVPDEMCLVGFERPLLRGDSLLQRPTVTFLTAACSCEAGAPTEHTPSTVNSSTVARSRRRSPQCLP